MLNPATGRQRGFSLLEMMIVVALLALLIGIAGPSLRTYIQNNHIRTAAESILSGIQLARTEAARRNAVVRFELRDEAGQNALWVVCADVPSTGNCPASVTGNQLVAQRTGYEGADKATVRLSTDVADIATSAFATRLSGTYSGTPGVTFNGLGRPTVINSVANVVRFEVRNLSMPDTNEKPLDIVITAGGSVRLCDPRIPTSATTNPQRCF